MTLSVFRVRAYKYIVYRVYNIVSGDEKSHRVAPSAEVSKCIYIYNIIAADTSLWCLSRFHEFAFTLEDAGCIIVIYTCVIHIYTLVYNVFGECQARAYGGEESI